MQFAFKKHEYVVTGNVKSNLGRVAHKISEWKVRNEDDDLVQDPTGVFKITDMIRATVVVNKPEQIISVYKALLGMQELNMIRCKNNLFDDDQFISLECIYMNRIIAEILIRCGSKPVNLAASALIANFRAAESIPKLKEKILMHLSTLAENGKIYMPIYDKELYDARLEEIAFDYRCTIVEDKLSEEEEAHYLFNMRPEVRKLAAEFKSFGIPLVDGYLFEKDYEFLKSEEAGEMFINACDNKTVYSFFSAKKHDGRYGLNTANQALRGTLNLGLWQTPFPEEDI